MNATVKASFRRGRNLAGSWSLVFATVLLVAAPVPAHAPEDVSIRPFAVHVPQAALDDLRRRIVATRCPDKETVDDLSQGAPLARVQALVEY